jgi:zinc transport system substrate-binding protein
MMAALGFARQQPANPAALHAVVTIAPLKGLIEPLLPPGSSVTILMEPGRSEHGYEFTPADMAAMAKADVFVYVGLGLEGRIESTLAKQTMPKRQVVCFADAVGIKAPQEGEDRHSDHDHDAHEHEEGPGYVDPHLWLDPILVGQLVPALRDAVYKAEEVNGAVSEAERKRLDEVAASLSDRIKTVDQEWARRLAPLKDRPVVTHHNAFGRPAARYGFRVAAVLREIEGSEPTPGDIQKVVEAIRAQGVKVIFVEPQFNAVAAERIAQVANVKIGKLDPLGTGDWFALMKSNLDALVSNLTENK